MIVIRTDLPKDKVYKIKPVLVDANKNVISDTVYGTGLDTYDRCDFLTYEDFTAYRTKRIKVHHFYQYDTFYHFAKGALMVKYNYCEYQGKDIYLRYNDSYSDKPQYHYVLIGDGNRIHLHDFNNELNARNSEAIKNKLRGVWVDMSCSDWALRPTDCKN